VHQFFSSLQKKEEGGGYVQIAQITYFHSSGYFVFTKQKVNKSDYHYYSLAPSGGSWATEEGTSAASESETASTRG
jgi:hypothetical protein